MAKHSSVVSSIKSLAKFTLKVALYALKLAYRLAVIAVEAVFWVLHGLSALFGFAKQTARSARAMASGVVTCPDGHAIPVGMTDTVHACTSCGFRYKGSPLACPNPECEAPIAAYVSCPTCSLSVSSPFRGQ